MKMRWLAAVLVCGLVCSVKAQDEESTDFLKIIANPTIVYNVGETKAIFCNSSFEDIKWISPANKVVEKRSNENTRIYVEKNTPLFGVPLIIHSIKISDSGNWTCRAGDLNETIDIIVGEKVVIAERDVNLEGDEGKSVKMTCEAKGQPTPVVVWYKDNSPITSSKDTTKYAFHKNNNTLEIKKLNHLDSGNYVCKVRQKALSHYTDKTYHLGVKHKPIFYNHKTKTIYSKYKIEEVYAILNETKNITCSAIANPVPSYHWYRTKNGVDSEELTDPELVAHSGDGNSSVLMLRMDDKSVLGQYKCACENDKGSEFILFHVSLGSKPDPPDFVAIVSTNVTEIVLNVTCSTCPMVSEADMSPNPENLTVTGYVFEVIKHKDNFEPDWDNAQHVEVAIANENETIFIVNGLDNSTKYRIRVASINAAGTSDWHVVPAIAETKALAFRLASTTLLILATLAITLYY